MAYLKTAGLLLVSLLFMLLGIRVLLAAYRLDDPFAFVLTFFSSNLIILVSAALSLGSVLKIVRLRKAGRQRHSKPPEET
jgi:hypothetical protein